MQEGVEEEYRKAREDLQVKQAQLAEEFLRQQKRYRIGLLRFLLRSNLLDILNAPIIYSGWIPFPVDGPLRDRLSDDLLPGPIAFPR